MKTIDHFSIALQGIIITFVRIADRVGWHTTVGGTQYGDYITVADIDGSTTVAREACEVLADHAADAVYRLIKDSGDAYQQTADDYKQALRSGVTDQFEKYGNH